MENKDKELIEAYKELSIFNDIKHHQWEENGEWFSSWTIKSKFPPMKGERSFTLTTGDGGFLEMYRVHKEEMEGISKGIYQTLKEKNINYYQGSLTIEKLEKLIEDIYKARDNDKVSN